MAFNVPIPAEVRSNWTGKKWDELEGVEREVVEGQIRGVSILTIDNERDCLLVLWLLLTMRILAMEREPNNELLSCGWEGVGEWN